jgi:site-specific DNA-methyltransferase (adenine-specific)
VLEHGTGGLNIDGSRVASDDGFEKAWDKPVSTNISAPGGKFISKGIQHTVDISSNRPVGGRFPANIIHDGSDEVLAGFPDTKGVVRQPTGKSILNPKTGWNDNSMTDTTVRGFADSGSAARFFYCAKASKRDRNEGLDGFEGQSIGAKGNGLARICATCSASTIQGCECPDRTYVNPKRQNHHPTVKPTDLMRYLVKLITPPNGIVLDPFTGSGSTGKGAVIEGFNFIGIELDPDYVAIATARIQHQLDNIEVTLFTGETS